MFCSQFVIEYYPVVVWRTFFLDSFIIGHSVNELRILQLELGDKAYLSLLHL